MYDNKETQVSTEFEAQVLASVEFFQSDVSSESRPKSHSMWGESVQY